MSVLEDIHNEVASYLSLSVTLTQRAGTQINVGEEFTLRFTLRNTASPSRRPTIIFRDLFLRVDATVYAHPRDAPPGSAIFVVIREGTLGPGELRTADVVLVADRNMGSDFVGFLADMFAQEEVATVRFSAALDLGAFFVVHKDQRLVQEIEPT
jgi:hypothetical protein